MAANQIFKTILIITLWSYLLLWSEIKEWNGGREKKCDKNNWVEDNIAWFESIACTHEDGLKRTWCKLKSIVWHLHVQIDEDREEEYNQQLSDRSSQQKSSLDEFGSCEELERINSARFDNFMILNVMCLTQLLKKVGQNKYSFFRKNLYSYVSILYPEIEVHFFVNNVLKDFLLFWWLIYSA